MRLFLAIALSPEVRERIVEEQEELRRRLEGLKLKWVARENLHLTKAFFGDVPAERLGELIACIARASAQVGRLDVEYRGFGAFPFRRPRIIWAGAYSSPYEALPHAMHQTEQACIAFLKPDERQDHYPHVTVARVSGRATADSSRAIEPVLEAFEWHKTVTQNVSELTLYQSHLTKDGSTYEAVEAFPLGK